LGELEDSVPLAAQKLVAIIYDIPEFLGDEDPFMNCSCVEVDAGGTRVLPHTDHTGILRGAWAC